MKKNIFITIEGTEGCGKTSIISALTDHFKRINKTLAVFREPGTTKIGEQIREILLHKGHNELSPHTELLLYLAARTQLIEEQLARALKNTDVVLCDRFYDSTLVYQGIGLGLRDAAEKGVAIFSLGIMPDLTLVLDVDPQPGLARIQAKDRMESKPLEFHQKIRQGFLDLAKAFPNRMVVIDASGAIADIYPRVLGAIQKRFPQF